ncbi:MAG TPA: aldo/keto reductase [Thermoanaerobaculia bacterium]|nr:aldo/keto reductase [Thermoanaerobaculia bacterium]
MIDRRGVVRYLAALGVAPLFRPLESFATPAELITRPIPSSGERIPAIGLGSWITFNVGDDTAARDACMEIIRAFLARGGRLIDSSPMYASSQATIGYAPTKLGRPQVFSADKVWTSSLAEGREQAEESRRFWGVPRFDLLEVHNLLAWEDHRPALFAMKKAGRLRYVGVTTSHGRRHAELETIMRRERLDFVQVTYNPSDREVEQRILPLARDRGMAVIINRPFQQGALIRRVERRPVPAWAREIDARSWAQVILKFIISHPAVTCAIPATTVIADARENVDAARGRLPDEELRSASFPTSRRRDVGLVDLPSL